MSTAPAAKPAPKTPEPTLRPASVSAEPPALPKPPGVPLDRAYLVSLKGAQSVLFVGCENELAAAACYLKFSGITRTKDNPLARQVAELPEECTRHRLQKGFIPIVAIGTQRGGFVREPDAAKGYMRRVTLKDGETRVRFILLNLEGQPIDADGRLVDEQGRLVNEQGQLIDPSGRLVNEQGQLLDPSQHTPRQVA